LKYEPTRLRQGLGVAAGGLVFLVLGSVVAARRASTPHRET